ncbi:hypothetical protein Cst_c21570 [Thermoclostridium stercorarium subsp. stercorarium DSM 8532]|uniref:Uncharacterized protein n=3 Tax=Thermoclostridium stercorarium TaxID=1510 RepID=L7VU89_THES1|nr:hypothetical protein Cst_c21570 [Thermoclostridium stercorarium subsp. stercorarium DSM 8532]AGI40093.1 hypothetical protein Clst_2062 [Thermoclostridium stercorarium subsp. stercorarium DSM 8532]ANW99408.1 hypothetical protein CSTERTH_10395 [Thermoclostridium stercorarium subsp. thermolacticum DSM 2910]ANX02034.1 hypothetical protein CSTERLE_10865 [Thermoclostridium stercorarium subsp. leptospartum DSM 9219]
MFKLYQEDMLSFYFNRSLGLEEVLMKKYDFFKKMIKDPILEDMINDFKKNSKEHIKELNDKMKRLGIQ